MAILAQRFPIYQPAMRIIQSITNAEFAFITTTFPHQYKTGLICRIYVPRGYGMTQANQMFGLIVVASDTTFNIDIDTLEFDPFVAPTTYPYNYQYAQVVPIGEFGEASIGDLSILPQPTRNVLPYPLT